MSGAHRPPGGAGGSDPGGLDDPGDLGDDLEVALRVADIADAITLARFDDRDFSLDWKANATEVTEVDRASERAIVEALVARRPRHAVFGEEHGDAGEAGSRWRWLVDPIDGTSGYVRGIPVWATLIGLTRDDVAVLGVISAPALGTRWWGGVGLGAHVRRRGTTRSIAVSEVADVAEAQVSVTHSPGWDALGRTERLVELQQRARRSRGFGDFWQHALVAEGALDVAVDAVGVAPYDLAAVQPVVEAAGGRFSDRRGEATHLHDTAVSSNGLLHDEVIDLLS
ncbi:inositol monophosphatase family protein [Ilumatobacter sp.]|uniref:inositol monophosphatase family protein n=1 Tax=Ilumatobacter sp. TaxID=1967498 RepID=UPI003B5199E7